MSAEPIRKNIKEWKKLYDFKDFVTFQSNSFNTIFFNCLRTIENNRKTMKTIEFITFAI